MAPTTGHGAVFNNIVENGYDCPVLVAVADKTKSDTERMRNIGSARFVVWPAWAAAAISMARSNVLICVSSLRPSPLSATNMHFLHNAPFWRKG